ncbi:lariat debranching enzyme-like [Ylistrum balloti]|uniref:lariat debranching enzyme-like n=1 Tax=Ylistrum balloti TaxID=509963 RepID=UPI0029058072|nr:lariat debranching enzyme-like [Ylistrum balloti]
MKIAVEGCCHGELDKIYETIEFIEKKENFKVDLLLICGDFQSVRNKSDLQCMAVPQKYQRMNTFYKYYSGEKVVPVLTIFIGGNHEASNYLQELPYGGWVAPNIYYMGYANVLKFGGVRIGGISGIYKGRDFNKGHFEHPPYNEESKRAAYHIRNLEVFRLKQLTKPIDIMMSHDWPRGIYDYGNTSQLLKTKQFLREEIESGSLGSPPAEELLMKLQPQYWFSAHLHVKFAAIVQHKALNGEEKITKFLSLDKCLPRRKFLQILDIPHDPQEPLKLQLDTEWLSILKLTDHLLSLKRGNIYMPGPGSQSRWEFKPTVEEENRILEDFGGDLLIPDNFQKTVDVFDPNQGKCKVNPPVTMVNPQTTLLCAMLDITDPNAVFLGQDSSNLLDVSGEGACDADDDDVDDDEETEFDSEPSFVSFVDSDQSYSSLLSSGNAEDSIMSLGTTGDLSYDIRDPVKNLSSSILTNPAEISLSDEEAEFKAIIEAQKKDNKESTERTKVVSVDEDEDEEDEFKAIMAAQKEHSLSVDQLTGPTLSLRPLTQSSPASSDERSDSEVTRKTNSLALNTSKRADGSESEDSPQSKKFKRRNQQIYKSESGDEETAYC